MRQSGESSGIWANRHNGPFVSRLQAETAWPYSRGVRMLIALGLALALALAGCGSSSDADRASSAPPPEASGSTRTVTTHKANLPPPCSRRAEVRLAATAGLPRDTVGTSTLSPPSGVRGCRLTAGDLEVVVLVDSAPQPFQRMEREAVEYAQEVVQTGRPGLAVPRTVKHLGLNAYWFPTQSRLLTTDGVRLITVMVHADLEMAARWDLATRLAGTYLGPLHKPPGY
jgi:hypothetical protein